jgi:hypothetical protein
MAQYGSDGPSSLGSLGIRPRFDLAPLPTILSEWAGLIPLACHFSSYQYSHRLIGEVAITGHLSVGLFPRLGALRSITRLLEQGPEFCDRASTFGNVGHEVWDVMWGSTFPCANGAASAIISAYALRRSKEALDLSDYQKGVSEREPEPHRPSTVSSSLLLASLCNRTGRPWSLVYKSYLAQAFPKSKSMAFDTPTGGHRRCQTLHILDFRRAPIVFSWRLRLYRILSSIRWEVSIVMLLLLGDVFLGLYGLYGTTAAVLCGLISRIACRFLRFKRPPGFLTNNENHDAFMLVAAHRNASTWYLFTGDRGIVDYLLNKPMFTIPRSNFWLSSWFRVGHTLQILSMTFVAAQRGWDGVAMTVLMLIEYFCDRYWNRHWLGAQWLEKQGVRIEARNFLFTGRTQMMTAIQALSGSSVTSWMDDIIVPHPRRDALLGYIDAMMTDPSKEPDTSNLDERVAQWVALQARFAIEAAEIIRREFPCIIDV